MSDHFLFSPSSSHRWVNCPASVQFIEKLKKEEKIKEESNQSAVDGTKAHDIAAKCLTNSTYCVDNIISNYVMDYVNYVESYISSSEDIVLIEQKVNFTHLIPGGFGTVDCAIVTDDFLHVIDFKYGEFVKVEARENYQLILYAIGVLQKLKKENKDRFNTVKSILLHIVQPRMSNFDVWELPIDDIAMYEQGFKYAYTLSTSSSPPFIAGSHCKYCPALARCKEANYFVNELNDYLNDFELTDDDYYQILNTKSIFERLIANVSTIVKDKLSQGQEIKGLELKQGRLMRNFLPDAENVLCAKLKENAYTKNLVSVTQAEKLLGKKELEGLNIIDYSRASPSIKVYEI